MDPLLLPQAEIQDYLRGCTVRFGVLPHVRLGQEVRAATWDEGAQHWVVETTAGPCTARVLVSLSEPQLPECRTSPPSPGPCSIRPAGTTATTWPASG